MRLNVAILVGFFFQWNIPINWLRQMKSWNNIEIFDEVNSHSNSFENVLIFGRKKNVKFRGPQWKSFEQCCNNMTVSKFTHSQMSSTTYIFRGGETTLSFVDLIFSFKKKSVDYRSMIALFVFSRSEVVKQQ